MSLASHRQVLVVGPSSGQASQEAGQGLSAPDRLADELRARGYDVLGCPDASSARFALATWTPDVVIVIPADEAHRHGDMLALRRVLRDVPLVVMTNDAGPDLLLDLEAFAPTLPAKPLRSTHAVDALEAALEQALAA